MPDPSLPRAIGPYAIVEKVQSRAFTVTYRAEQRAVGRTVLLETLKPTLSAGSSFAAGLEREALVLGRLDHEGVPRLHDFVRTPEVVYLVLEDARAVPLEAVLAATKLEVDVAAAIAIGAARALAHGHERGVVHRALSIAALAIAPPGRVVLGDFARADAKIAGLSSVPEATIAGDDGTVASFFAPELILGDAADARADVWALGVVLHVLLAGAHPFAGDDPRDVAQRIRTSAPAKLPDAVPSSLARVVARCLAKDPGDRFADARAVVVALEEALASRTDVPVTVLVSRALAAAGLGEALPVPTGAVRVGDAPGSVVDVAGAARGLALVLAFVVAGGATIRLLDDRDAGEGEGVSEMAPTGASRHDAGLLRIVAKPWAEVYVDGELVDTTPIGRPIAVAPGRHYVTLRHPNAPDEQRSIKVAPGQSVFLDVTMRVDRGDAGAGDAGSTPASP